LLGAIKRASLPIDMLTSTLILAVILLSLGDAVRSHRRGLIAGRPYNNRYSDATAARDDRY
jgi:hypothetical protein